MTWVLLSFLRLCSIVCIQARSFDCFERLCSGVYAQASMLKRLCPNVYAQASMLKRLCSSVTRALLHVCRCSQLQVSLHSSW